MNDKSRHLRKLQQLALQLELRRLLASRNQVGASERLRRQAEDELAGRQQQLNNNVQGLGPGPAWLQRSTLDHIQWLGRQVAAGHQRLERQRLQADQARTQLAVATKNLARQHGRLLALDAMMARQQHCRLRISEARSEQDSLEQSLHNRRR